MPGRIAGNALLCRMALKHTAIDPANFTSVRIITATGGVMLLGEPITLRLPGASIAVLGGIAFVTARRKPVG